MNPVKTFLKKHLSRDEVFLSILLLVTPLTAFYLMQFAYSGGLPWEYSLNVLLANYLCIGVVHFTLCAVTNYIVVCSILTHILCCICLLYTSRWEQFSEYQNQKKEYWLAFVWIKRTFRCV